MIDSKKNTHKNITRIRWKVLALLGIWLVVINLSCSSKAPIKPITTTDIIGNWYIDSVSHSNLPDSYQAYYPNFILNKDMTFELNDFPAIMVFAIDVRESELLVAGKGEWEIVNYTGKQEIQLIFNSFSSGNIFDVPSYAMKIDYLQKDDNIILCQWYTDADHLPLIKFIMQERSN